MGTVPVMGYCLFAMPHMGSSGQLSSWIYE